MVLIQNRFFVHLSIQAFAAAIMNKYGKANEKAMLFPSTSVAMRCLDFITTHGQAALYEDHLEKGENPRVLDLVLTNSNGAASGNGEQLTMISAVLYPDAYQQFASKFWQHCGDGVSSRRAEFFHKAFDEGFLAPRDQENPERKVIRSKGPRRYQRGGSVDLEGIAGQSHEAPVPSGEHKWTRDHLDSVLFVEERFGRNLDLSLARQAKLAIRRRIAGSLTANVDLNEALNLSMHTAPTRQAINFSEDDVYLYPTGMSAISNTHRTLLNACGSSRSIMFG